jgi:replicative DNA helicase
MSDVTATREPPHRPDVEAAILGTLMVHGAGVVDRVRDTLAPEDFAFECNGELYREITRRADQGDRIDQLLLREFAEQQPALAQAGGFKYLMNLSGAACGPSLIKAYAEAVRHCSVRRRVMRLGEDAIALALHPDDAMDADAVIEEVERWTSALGDATDTSGGPVSLADSVPPYLARIEETAKADGKVLGVSSGIADIDRLVGGLKPDRLVVLAGRASMGKTALALTWLLAAAKAGVPVAIFSLEMSREQLLGRLVAAETGIDTFRQENGPLSNLDVESIVQATGHLRKLPIHIDDTPGLTAQQIRLRSARLKRRFKIGMVVVDHIQLMRGDRIRKSENRVQEISDITGTLKGVAKELGLPVVALSQLNRGVEARDDKRPGLADLRDSGTIEQDADIVLFLFREQYYVDRAEPMQTAGEDPTKFDKRHQDWKAHRDRVRNLAELIAAKSRDGQIGSTTLFFDGARSRFTGLRRGDE